jgi:hypothetical protein
MSQTHDLPACSIVAEPQKNSTFEELLFGYYATSRKVVGSGHDEVNEFFSIYLILPAALGSGI